MCVQRLKTILFAPFSALFRLGVECRYFLYRSSLLKRTSFALPVISVGNLSVGGTGKTPHVELLVNVLRKRGLVGVLSRGYGRNTKGFRWVSAEDSAAAIGDEPFQLRHKFPDIAIAVGERRVLAIPEMVAEYPSLSAIILDDAYQHLAVKPGLSILLTRFDQPYWADHLLPAGWLREPRSAAARADIIIVTKCPIPVTAAAQKAIIKRMQVAPHQKVYFSTFAYGEPYPLWPNDVTTCTHVVAVAGIADPEQFFDAVRNHCTSNVIPVPFPDHHAFTRKDIRRISTLFGNLAARKKACVVTEKDAARLRPYEAEFAAAGIPVMVLPVVVELLHDNDAFYNDVQSFIDNFES